MSHTPTSASETPHDQAHPVLDTTTTTTTTTTTITTTTTTVTSTTTTITATPTTTPIVKHGMCLIMGGLTSASLAVRHLNTLHDLIIRDQPLGGRVALSFW